MIKIEKLEEYTEQSLFDVLDKLLSNNELFQPDACSITHSSCINQLVVSSKVFNVIRKCPRSLGCVNTYGEPHKVALDPESLVSNLQQGLHGHLFVHGYNRSIPLYCYFGSTEHVDLILVPNNQFVVDASPVIKLDSAGSRSHLLGEYISDAYGQLEKHRIRCKQIELSTASEMLLTEAHHTPGTMLNQAVDPETQPDLVKAGNIGVLRGAVVMKNSKLPEHLILVQGDSDDPLESVDLTDPKAAVKAKWIAKQAEDNKVDTLILGSSVVTMRTLDGVVLHKNEHRHVYAKYTDGSVSNCNDCGFTYKEHLDEKLKVAQFKQGSTMQHIPIENC